VYQARAVGGTAIGTWLAMARQLLDGYPSVVRHVLMFTDGRNEHETGEHLAEVLEQCRGRFVCDARGIGDLWVPDELDRIVTVLNGQSDAVRRFADLADDFRQLMRSAMGRVVPDVSLRLSLMSGTELGFVKQVYPTIANLTPQGGDAGLDFYTGSWGDEQRDYHVSLTVDSKDRPVDKDTVAARVEVVLGDGSVVDDAIALPELPGLIQVVWTTDPVLFTRSHPTVNHYLGQQELAELVRSGCAALEEREYDLAVVKLGRAVALATSTGDERLIELVEIEDAKQGKVVLRGDSELINIIWNVGGSRFTQLDPDGMPVRPPVAVDPGISIGRCPDCAEPYFAGDVFCESCKRPVATAEQTQ
jgi:Ca-activated chloride channel family protein